MKSKKSIAIAAVIAIMLIGVVVLWMFRDFDAQGYVQSVLDQRFHGDVTNAATFIDDKTEEELLAQYEEEMQAFVESNITAGVEMDEELHAQYVELCKEIFKTMAYTVDEAEKINYKEYHVLVTFEPIDVFQTFSAAVPTESARLMEKVNNGEYKGTLEEINAQMQSEFLTNCYELLKSSYKNRQYGEAETITFFVKKNEDGLFAIDEGQVHEFLLKITGLDVNQD